MIEVLKRGTRHRITCPECGSLLAYWEADVRYTGDYRDDNPRYINCPVCKSEIKIPKSEDTDNA